MQQYCVTILLSMMLCSAANNAEDKRGYQLAPTCNLTSSAICNGHNNCGDWSDEAGCTCPDDKFKCDCYEKGCTTRWGCIDSTWVCDHENDCGDWSDEKNCSCPSDSFRCETHNNCIDSLLHCDGHDDCGDGSDERGTPCPGPISGICPIANSGTNCISTCTPLEARCNGEFDCNDGSDEINCQCSDTKFQCATCTTNCSNTDDCITRSQVSDGHTDCVDGSDEEICSNGSLHQDGTFCGCIQSESECTEPGRCILRSWIGDGISDCDDGSDEPCVVTKSWCGSCLVIYNRCPTEESKDSIMRFALENTTTCHRINAQCDGQNECREWICSTTACEECHNKTFHCGNGNILDKKYFCDASQHCVDESDEETEGLGFRCSGQLRERKCLLPQKNLYDSIAQCADQSDLCFMNGEFKCFRCLDGKHVISPHQVCDGIVDCYDVSDECLCQDSSVCDEVLGDKLSRCLSDQMHCRSETDCVSTEIILCNASVSCINDTNVRFCPLHQKDKDYRVCFLYDFTIKRATKCDGRFECDELEDECDCDPPPLFCDANCTKIFAHNMMASQICDGYISVDTNHFAMYQPDYFTPKKLGNCPEIVEQNCPMRFYCKSRNLISIDKNLVCDGIIDCDDGSDENKTLCKDRSFYCKNGDASSVNINFICDGISDCDNGEDESKDLCEKEVFYCENGDPLLIRKEFLDNGIRDCSDGSDECSSLFSDRYEMISHPFLRALFWIMGLLALIGNFLVNIVTVRNLICTSSKGITRLAQSVFIFNLTVSDFLMGVYLLVVVIQGIRYSGSYCLFDKQWRSSKLCSGLGVLALLSSQTSAFLMAVLSTFRLLAVNKSFVVMPHKAKWIVLATIMCWILSGTIALVPLLPYSSGYFVSEIWFPNYFLKTDTPSKVDVVALVQKLPFETKKITTQWSDAKEVMHDAFPYNAIRGEFGYYGKTSICMPRFYASTNEAAWEYSLFVITVNFVMFMWMVICYVAVYKKSNRMDLSGSEGKDMSVQMQKRISRLLLTDFCCWIPVCIMGYVSIGGVDLPPNAYVASAAFLLPINSALNPLIYSEIIENRFQKVKAWFGAKISPVLSSKFSKQGTTERVVELPMEDINS